MTKAFLLGAGLGTRLRPLTNALPKPLIPVFHRPLLTHAMDRCLEAGIKEFAINTHHLPDEWGKAFPGGEYKGAPITLFHEPVLLETGGGIKNIESWIGRDPVLVVNGDILTDLALDKLITAHMATNNVVTLALRSDGPARHIAVNGRRVVDIHHKLGVAEGTHQFTGIYCIDPEILDLIPPAEKVSVIPAFLELAGQGLLGASLRDDGAWLDLGTREAYLAAHAAQPEGERIHPEAEIHPTARVESSTIGPGCRVGAGAVVRDSLLWPKTEVSPGAQLTNCIVYSSLPAVGAHENADL